MIDNNNYSDAFKIQNETMEYINARIAEIQKHYEYRIESIRKIGEKYFQLLCLFSLIDSLAQEYSNYSIGQEQKKSPLLFFNFKKNLSFLNSLIPLPYIMTCRNIWMIQLIWIYSLGEIFIHLRT